ncbi:uncharacterized protein LOC103524116 [Trichonephila clavipes]|nr:uncharacterized protein LOC103524116 [Trichonephila clavipes]
MQLQTEISGSSERRQYSALSLGERLMRKEHLWPKNIPSQTKLKTQNTFLFEFQRLAKVFGVSVNRLPLFKPTTFPGHLRHASANLDLVQPVHKHNSLLVELRSAALATIHNGYPDEDWLHVFTDGSTTASFGRAGAGAFSNSFNLKEPFSAWSDNFDNEIYAIFFVFRAISATPGQNIVIVIDSQATIKTKLEFQCKQLINSFLCTGREVLLQWIPSHCGIHGNEKADKLAKEALMLYPSCLSMPLRNTKRLHSDKFQQKRIFTFTDLAVGKS